MIRGDKVVLLEYAACPTLVSYEGVIHNFREVGLKATNIEYEYLIKFNPDGPYKWIPSRYLKQIP